MFCVVGVFDWWCVVSELLIILVCSKAGQICTAVDERQEDRSRKNLGIRLVLPDGAEASGMAGHTRNK